MLRLTFPPCLTHHNLTVNNTTAINITANSNYTSSHITSHASMSNTLARPRKRSRRKSKPAKLPLDHSSVINLSNSILSPDEKFVLARGLTFCPTPRHINWPEISADIYHFARRMRLTEYFFDENNTTNVNKPKPIRDNLTTSKRQAIHQLKQRQDIVIKPADKGSGTVIMDKTWYIDECNRQLNDSKFYRRLNEDITVNIQKRVTVYANRMYTDDLIDEKTKQYLIQPDVKPGRFYILPKVHKPGNPGRPIVSSKSHPTEHISHFIDHHLQPLVHKLPSYVKDTNDFLNKLLTIGKLPSNSLLVTLDVSSLYTNIPHNEGINACDHFLRTA